MAKAEDIIGLIEGVLLAASQADCVFENASQDAVDNDLIAGSGACMWDHLELDWGKVRCNSLRCSLDKFWEVDPDTHRHNDLGRGNLKVL